MKSTSSNISEPKFKYANSETDALFDKAQEAFSTYMECVSKLRELKVMEITNEEITFQTRYMPLQSPYCALECGSLRHEADYPSLTEYASVLVASVLRKSLHENLHLDSVMCKSKMDGVDFCIEGQVSSEDLKILHELILQPEFHGRKM